MSKKKGAAPAPEPVKQEEEEEVKDGDSWDTRIERDWAAIEFAPDEYRRDREFMLKLVRRSGFALEFIAPELLEELDEELVLEAVKTSHGEALKWAPREMHRNRDFMLECVAVSAEVMRYVSNRAINDEGAKIKAIRGLFYCMRRNGKDGLPFAKGPCNPSNGVQCDSCARFLDGDPLGCPLPCDRHFIKRALHRNWHVLKHADKEMRAEKEIVLEAVGVAGLALLYASEELQADPELALAAVRQDWQVFKHLSRQLRGDRAIARAAVQQHWYALKAFAKEVRTDRELAAEAIKQGWEAFAHVPKELKADRQLALQAVERGWQAFEHVSADLRGDRELALLAVRQNGQALSLVPEALRSDVEVVMEAIKQDWRALKFASAALRGDKSVVLEAVKQNGFALQHAVEDLRSNPDLVAAAMGQQWPSVKVAVQPLFPAKDGLDPTFWNKMSTESGLLGKKFRPAVALVN